MSDGSPIEWLDRPGTKSASWNPLRARETRTGKIGWHCEHVHEGCRHCYAEAINKRLGTGFEYKPGHLLKPDYFEDKDGVEPFLDEKTLLQPLKWKSPRTIFVCSMTDLYGPWIKDEWLDKIKAVQALTPQHTYIELTKRPERMRDYASQTDLPQRIADRATIEGRNLHGSHPGWHAKNWSMNISRPVRAHWPLRNVWGLVSCSTQEDADKFIPILLATPLAIRGVSAEPLLGPIDFTRLRAPADPDDADAKAEWLFNALISGDIYEQRFGNSFGDVFYDTGDGPYRDSKLDWIIVGGESGRNARPMHPDWARSIKAQCESAGVAMFFKQWGEWHAPDYAELFDTSKGRNGKPPAFIVNSDGTVHCFEAGGNIDSRSTPMTRIGKAKSGRLLDGAEHNGFPQARTT